MDSKQVKLLLTFGVLALAAVGIWFAQHKREKDSAAKREAGYQRILGECKSKLKPGITRRELEQHFHVHGTHFKQMCCVARLTGRSPRRRTRSRDLFSFPTYAFRRLGFLFRYTSDKNT